MAIAAIALESALAKGCAQRSPRSRLAIDFAEHDIQRGEDRGDIGEQ
ncbi:hypothetical protein [Sphingomonas quercus]|uniref:Uncharacterized protein n=1 Tax=Sphingomonas quercus TaxID=2842451 RepID=A0ABS6BHQ3_9SPHN|nr:hypothetical protein [Sphingomonas quercus]MBU3077840.1 hypothetical protein [Sphingomonas quercus]